MIGDLARDLRYAMRSLRLRPAFALMVVVTLALGMAANVTIFSLVNAVILRPLPVPEPERLVLFMDGGQIGRSIGPPTNADNRILLYSYPLYEQLRDGMLDLKIAVQDSMLTNALVRRPGATDTDLDGEESADGRCVSANFFEVLGLSPFMGRTFTPEDELIPEANPVVVLSHRFWERRFEADRAIIGQKLSIDGKAYTVIGVAPPAFTGATVGSATDFWVPIGMAASFTKFGSAVNDPLHSWLQPFGRLAPGATLESAQANANAALVPYVAELARVRARSVGATQAEAELRGLHIELQSGETGFSRMRLQFREPLLVLMTGVGLLLLIVCLNVSHLILARAVRREHELGIRVALGASRSRIVRQLLTEGFILSALGALLGALTSHVLTGVLVAMASVKAGPLSFNLVVEPDARVLWFNVALALVTTLLLGLVPAAHAARLDVQRALSATAQAIASGGTKRRVSRVLMMSQVAFSLVLLVGAGLLSESLLRLRSMTSGFDEEHVLVADLNPNLAHLDEARTRQLYEDIRRRISAIPSVIAVSASHPGVFNGRMAWRISFPGTALPAKGFAFFVVTPGYFDALGMRLLRGRDLSPSDSWTSPRVAVVNETMATREFGGREALGQRINLDGVNDVEVVGVVSDARTMHLSRAMEPHFYLSAAQPSGLPMAITLASLEVRGEGDPVRLAHQVRRAVDEVQSGLPLFNLRTLTEQVDRTLVKERLLALLASAFGLVATFLVAVGLYGVVSQWATERTRELGIRMALGATPSRVRWLVLRQALSMVAVGIALGVPAAFAISGLLQGMLYEVSSVEPHALGLAALALAAAAALAAYLPARRASRLDPVAALRSE